MGELLGKKLMPRILTDYAVQAGFPVGVSKTTKLPAGTHPWALVTMIATTLGESQGYTEAINWNKDENGKLISYDFGVTQENVPVSQYTSELEHRLYDPLTNYKWAYSKWKGRGFWPWYAWVLGWCDFPEWWIWSKSEPHHWAKTGRYMQRALVGVANWHLVVKKDMDGKQALALAKAYQEHFGIKGTLKVGSTVMWSYVPPAPTKPPADNVGPRPVDKRDL